MKRPRGLAKLTTTLKLVCKIIGLFGPGIRQFVPDPQKSAYDDALAAVNSACDVIRAIEYLDENPGTNAPWGEQSALIG